MGEAFEEGQGPRRAVELVMMMMMMMFKDQVHTSSSCHLPPS
jgi:hypothetical protein